MKTRTEKAKINIILSLIQQGAALICGLILPKMMIGAFGSEANGAIASIATFLSYITLLDGGIGAVTRSALYRAFAGKSEEQISAIFYETKRLYRKIAIAFLIYVLFIAFFFKQISHNIAFDYWYSFSLVLVVALSTFAEYFIGITYSLLIQADQSQYIISIISTASTVLNTVLCVLLIRLKYDILTVKLLSAVVFVLKPIALAVYAKKHYKLAKVTSGEKMLTQKGSAIGQHLAWVLHNNTDVTVLTVFKDLTLVSVYSVYNMVIGQLRNLISSFTSGMEAVFGNMLANNEKNTLQRTFGYYETLLSLVSVSVFSTAAVMIASFVHLYTIDVADVEYVYPTFGVALMMASLLYCLRVPYEHMVIAAGHFRQTNMAAYGEAAINIVVSIVLVIRFGLIGVAIGTVVATLFRFVYYVRYLSQNLLNRPINRWIKRMLINTVSCVLIITLGNRIILFFNIGGYLIWAVSGAAVLFLAGIITLGINYAFYRNDVSEIMIRGFGRLFSKKSKHISGN